MIINMTDHVLWLDPNKSLAVSETIANGKFKFNGVDLSNPDFDFQLYDTVIIAVPCNNHEPKPDDIVVDDSAEPSIRLDAGKIYVNVVVNNSNSDSNNNNNTNTNQADQSSSNSSSSSSDSNSDASSKSDSEIRRDVTDVIIVDRPRNTVLAIIGAAIGISCFGIGYAYAKDPSDAKTDDLKEAPEPTPPADDEVIHGGNGETR
jgi:ABC-type antimicrobial peptide transport system permease subunit